MSASDRLEELATTAERTEPPCDPDATVDVLDDEAAVALFQAATSPTSIPDLAEACDLAQSTAYRKVRKLVRAGLLEAVTPKTANGAPPARYQRAIDAVTVTLSDDLVVAPASDDA